MSSIWNSALNMLARREHSRYELHAKLQKKYPDQNDEIEQVLDRLIDSGLQSDERYAEMWLRSQISKGRGPVRIRLEARQKGVEERISQLIDSPDTDWYQLAFELAERKFSAGIDYETKGKAYRFMAYRGFSSDMIQYAIDALNQKLAE